MKTSILLLIAFVVFTSLETKCQGRSYSYDSAGNRIERKVLVLSGKKSNTNSLIENDSFKEAIEDQTFSPETLKLYPNPTKGLLEIEIPINAQDVDLYSIKVTDINGKVIIEKKLESSRTQVDLSGEQDGIYLLLLFDGQRSSVWKIIKN